MHRDAPGRSGRAEYIQCWCCWIEQHHDMREEITSPPPPPPSLSSLSLSLGRNLVPESCGDGGVWLWWYVWIISKISRFQKSNQCLARNACLSSPSKAQSHNFLEIGSARLQLVHPLSSLHKWPPVASFSRSVAVSFFYSSLSVRRGEEEEGGWREGREKKRFGRGRVTFAGVRHRE